MLPESYNVPTWTRRQVHPTLFYGRTTMSSSRARREAVKDIANEKKHNQPKKIWPAILAVLGLVLVAVAGWTFFKEPASVFLEDLTSSGTPVLQVDQEKVDVGDVKLGKTVQVTFQLTNAGTKALRFSKAPYVEIVEGC